MTTKEAIKEAIADIKHSVNWAKENDERWCDSIEVGSLELAIKALEQPERKKGKWIIEKMYTYELLNGTTAYEPVYRCSVCERLTESYLRMDEPIMPEDADFPRFCPWCGAELEVPKDV